MIARPVGLLLVALALPPGLLAARPWPVALQTRVVDQSRVFDGEIALYVKDLQSGVRYTHNAATPSYLASGVKVLVMIAVFEAVAAGQLGFDTQLDFGPEDVRDGTPVLKPDMVGARFKVEQILGWMMQRSDNAATDLLVKAVGVDAVNDAARRYGGPGFGPVTPMLEVRRLVYSQLDPRSTTLEASAIRRVRELRSYDARARMLGALLHPKPVKAGKKKPLYTRQQLLDAYRRYYDTGVNSAPIESFGLILEHLARLEVVNPESSQHMLELMLGCQTGSRRIRGGLPKQVPLAHKTGTQLRRVCDLGIFYLDDERPVVFAACLKEFDNLRKAEGVIAATARETHRLLLRAGRPQVQVSPLSAGEVEPIAPVDTAPLSSLLTSEPPEEALQTGAQLDPPPAFYGVERPITEP